MTLNLYDFLIGFGGGFVYGCAWFLLYYRLKQAEADRRRKYGEL